MGIAQFESRTWWRSPALMVLGCALAGASLGGCGSVSEKFSNTAAEAPAIGLPAGAPPRPAAQAAYPAVHDMPPTRPAVMTGAEQVKMEDELVAARNHQQTVVGLPTSPPPASYAPAPAAKNPLAPPPATKKNRPAANKKQQPAATAAPAPPSSSTRSIY